MMYHYVKYLAILAGSKMAVSVSLTALLLTTTLLSRSQGQEVRLGGCVDFQGDPNFDIAYIQKVSQINRESLPYEMFLKHDIRNIVTDK